MEEQILLVRAINGDKMAVKEIIKNSQNLLYEISKMKLENEEYVEVAVKNTIFKIYNNIHKLSDTKRFKVFLIRNLIDECNKIIRRKKYIALNNMKIKYDYSISLNHLMNGLSQNDNLLILLLYKYRFSFEDLSYILRRNKKYLKREISKIKNIVKNNIIDMECWM